MKNKFEFLGIRSPVCKDLYRNFCKLYQPKNELELIEWTILLWSKPYREYKYIAMLELQKSKKMISAISIPVIEGFITSESWWDTVDMLSSNILGNYYLSNTDLLSDAIGKWSCNSNMWLNRTAILVQLKYKQNTSTELLERAIHNHQMSIDFFHQKAIGWALREYSKTNKIWVKEYVKANRANMKPLSIREALKYS